MSLPRSLWDVVVGRKLARFHVATQHRHRADALIQLGVDTDHVDPCWKPSRHDEALSSSIEQRKEADRISSCIEVTEENPTAEARQFSDSEDLFAVGCP